MVEPGRVLGDILRGCAHVIYMSAVVMAAEYGVSRTTILEALAQHREEGLVYTVPPVGHVRGGALESPGRGI